MININKKKGFSQNYFRFFCEEDAANCEKKSPNAGNYTKYLLTIK